MLGNELRKLVDVAKKSTEYLNWRRKVLTKDFYTLMNKLAGENKYGMDVTFDSVEEIDHWHKWATDHDLKLDIVDQHRGKIWWVIHG